MHQLIAEETGGSVGVRDVGLLESALNNAYATFGGEELYKTKEEKAASLGFSLISNHAFVDGNKRIAALLFIWFMQNNGILCRQDGSMRLSNETLVALTLMIAESRMDEMDIMLKVIVNLINNR